MFFVLKSDMWIMAIIDRLNVTHIPLSRMENSMDSRDKKGESGAQRRVG